MRNLLYLTIALSLLGILPAGAQNVDVTFRYLPPASSSPPYFVAGEFNGWSNNQNVLSPGEGGYYEATISLPVGGQPSGGIPGAVQYKFYYSGVGAWPSDPLNPRMNGADNNNSILYITNPTIYHFVPNQVSGLVRTSRPVISAYIYPVQGGSVDTGSITLTVDSLTVSNMGTFFDPSRNRLQFPLTWDLQNGTHKAWLSVGGVTDSVSFSTQSGFVQILNRSGYTTQKPAWTIHGFVEDTSRSSARLVHNGTDTTEASIVTGTFTSSVGLVEGVNEFRAIVVDSGGVEKVSDPFSIIRYIDHRPWPRVSISLNGSMLELSASGSTDPEGDIASYQWETIEGNPETIAGLDGAMGVSVQIPLPATPGEYRYRMISQDSLGHADTTRQFFTVVSPDSVVGSSYATTPEWVDRGRMYSLFFKSMTPEGTINAARPYLPYLKSLGVNVIWTLPVMENAYPINNGIGPGYNIRNFLRVAPEYGTNADFKEFVSEAHALGMRVILDVTPNHTSFAHPFVSDARTYRDHSPYWPYYVHSIIPHNTNFLGQSLTHDGFNYYSGFSDQLLNYNWADSDARSYMIGVYDWWIQEFDLDGYRFDAYWGPRRRTGNGAGGSSEMGYPTRLALKKRKADILLLAEDEGTGFGTEVVYADNGGGVDAAYDWNLYHNGIKSFAFSETSVNTLHDKLLNDAYVPGPHAKFLRFLENHDEERIAYVYGSYDKTKPVSTATLMAPGMPLLYAGQEVGRGIGVSDFDARRRGVIDWFAPGRETLLPHYQRLFQARRQFRAFDTQVMRRVGTSDPLVYAYVRPYENEDALVVVNFTGVVKSTTIRLNSTVLGTITPDGAAYKLSDLYTDSVRSVVSSNGDIDVQISLQPFGSFIGILSDSSKTLELPSLTRISEIQTSGTYPQRFELHQNYPNPFNPTTRIRFEIPASDMVSLKIYNAIGQEVASVVDEHLQAGTHTVSWSAAGWLSSGLYIARLKTSTGSRSLRLLLIR